MDHVDLGPIDDYPIAQPHFVDSPSLGPVFVYRFNDAECYVMRAICPHAGMMLSEYDCEGAVITCPLHGWQFNVRGGSFLEDETIGLTNLKHTLDDGHLWVQPPES